MISNWYVRCCVSGFMTTEQLDESRFGPTIGYVYGKNENPIPYTGKCASWGMRVSRHFPSPRIQPPIWIGAHSNHEMVPIWIPTHRLHSVLRAENEFGISLNEWEMWGKGMCDWGRRGRFRRGIWQCSRYVMSCGKPVESSWLDNLAGAHTCCLRISWIVYTQNNIDVEACWMWGFGKRKRLLSMFVIDKYSLVYLLVHILLPSTWPFDLGDSEYSFFHFYGDLCALIALLWNVPRW
jgi:hypothetical protein